jgi:hypothetical protein
VQGVRGADEVADLLSERWAANPDKKVLSPERGRIEFNGDRDL